MLLERHGDYYLSITTYQDREPTPPPPPRTVGIDFGVETQLTLSVGLAIRYGVPLRLAKRLRRLHQKLSRQQRRSRNWHRTRHQLEKVYARLNAIKGDIRHKLVHFLTPRFRGGVLSGRDPARLATALGRQAPIHRAGRTNRRALEERAQTPVRVDGWHPSTKTCSSCGAVRDMRLDERGYCCPGCGLVVDRGLNASCNIETEGLKTVDMGRTDDKPVETGAATLAWLERLNRIPCVRASLVGEAGSLTALA